MIKITFIEADGYTHVIDVKQGTPLMTAAVNSSVRGIEGNCGGAAACGTCHVFVDPVWTDVVGAAPDGEREMLELAEFATDNSRLACQIIASEAMDGLVLRVPPQN